MLIACGIAEAGPGDLDTTFGVGGVASTQSPGNDLQGKFIALQPDGKIVVVGQTGCDLCTFSDLVVARFSANGIVDSSFGNNGKVLISFNNVTIPTAISVQSDGKIVVAGFTHPATPPANFFVQPVVPLTMALARLTTDGALDPAFGNGGKQTVPLLYND